MKKWLIKYKVFGKEYKIGPYDASEVRCQSNDIRGYEGVTDVEEVAIPNIGECGIIDPITELPV